MASPRVLSPAQRQKRKAYGVDSWMNRKNFRVRRETLYATLGTFAFRLSKHSVDGTADPLELAKLARVIIAGDAGILEWFSQYKKGSKILKTDEGWEDLVQVVAGALVERYLADEQPPTVADVEPIIEERRRDELAELIDLAVETARLSQDAGQTLGEALYTSPTVPDLKEWAAKQLEQIAEEDASSLVFFDVEEDEDEPIPRRERDKEVAKGALMRLSVTELRELGGEDAPGGSSNMDALTSYVVDKYGSDSETIAELIYRYERPPPEHGLTTRIVSISDEPDVAKARKRIDAFRGRYMRIGVARWFIFEDARVSTTNDELILKGRIRYYSPSLRVEYGEYALDLGLGTGEAELRLRSGHAWLELTVKRAGDVGGITRALERVTGIQTHANLPVHAAVTEGPLMHVDRRTLQILDFLYTGFRGTGLRVTNMTTARFESDTPRVTADQTRPQVRAVQLEGNQLSSHPQACSMIMQGRALLSLDLMLEAGLSGGPARIPVRLELARNHAAIFTALTAGISDSDTGRVHRDLMRRFEVSLESGIRDAAALAVEGRRIAERAGAREEDLQADILIQGAVQSDGPDSAKASA